jgi:hypothetical protein
MPGCKCAGTLCAAHLFLQIQIKLDADVFISLQALLLIYLPLCSHRHTLKYILTGTLSI